MITSWKERFTCIPPNLLSLIIPLMVVGTITTGVFTPTEAAAVAMVYVFLVNVIKGDMKLRLQDLRETFYSGANVVGFMGLLIIGALLSKVALMQYHVADALAGMVTAVGANKLLILVMMTFLLFLMGCIGEHNDCVYGVILGMSREEIEELEREKISGIIPLPGADGTAPRSSGT